MDLLWEAIRDAAGLIARADAELLRIAMLSLAVSASATGLAAALGIPLGIALHIGHFRGRATASLAINAGMGLPPVVVGLVVMLLLWRTGPLGALRLLYTPSAMVAAQVLVALPLVAGITRTAISLLDVDLRLAMRADGASETRIGRELAAAALPQVLVAAAAGFGRAISEVGASLMVGGNIVGQTRIMTTAIALEASRGEFALALALGFVLLALAFGVNALLGLAGQSRAELA
ncbi:MAG: ABC transporter permease subunit [Chloroflexi bacterium]|nr:MAG: ABC transporter permease subunit [Chloroflexota bacterium]